MVLRSCALCFLISLIGVLPLKGQTPTMDSLRVQLATSHDVGRKINALMDITKLFRNVNFDSAVYYANKAYELSQSSDDLAIKAKVHSMMGTISMMSLGPERAIEHFKKGVEYAEAANDLTLLSRLYANIGKAYSDLGDVAKGIDYNLKALKIGKETNSLEDIAHAEYSLATIYQGNGNPDLSLEHAQASVAHFSEMKDKKWQSILWRVIGDLFASKKDHAQSQASYKKALRFAKDTLPLSDLVTDVLTSHASLYIELNKLDSAVLLLDIAEGVAQKINRESIKLDILYSKAGLYEKQGKYDKYVAAMEEMLKYSNGMIVGNKVILLSMLANGYSKVGDHKKAYDRLLEAANIRDTILNTENLTKVRILRDSFLLEVQKKEFEQKIEEEKEVKNQAFMLVAALGIFLALLALYFRTRLRANRVIREKNQVMETQYKELLHLNYVKDQMFAMLSHDLRTPLRTALRLTAHAQEADARANLRALLENTSSLLDNLLLWAKSQIGGLKMMPTEVNLKHTVDEVLSTLNEDIDQKMLRIANQVPDEANVWFDQQILSTVIRNIMTNAIQHSPREKTITIDNFVDSGETIVTIADQGEGIPHQIADNVVKGEISKSSTSKFGSGGIGLTLSTQLLKAAQGRLEYAYGPSGGTVFKIIIPA